jgi:hypothetical protein
MMTSPYQTPKRAKRVKQDARDLCGDGVERDRSIFSIDTHCRAKEGLWVDWVASSKCGIADEVKPVGFSVSTNEAMQYESIIDAIQENGPDADVCWSGRADFYDFTMADRRGHTLSTRFEMNRRALAQKFDKDFLGIKKCSQIRFFFCAHDRESHMKKVQKP